MGPADLTDESVRPHRFDDPKAAQYYAWKFPGAPVRIYIHLKTVSHLREYIQSCLHSDPSQSIECGGLLIGTVRSRQVEVTDFVPFHLEDLSCDFVLSVDAKDRIVKIIKEQHEKKTTVVGYFRSSLRGLRLSDDDLTLIKEQFPEPDKVFLIIAPDEGGTPTAGFFFWESGQVFADATFMPFPFDERLLKSSTPQTLLVEQPNPRPVAAPALNLKPKHSTSQFFGFAAAVLLIMATGMTIGMYMQSTTDNRSVPVPTVNTIATGGGSSAAPLSLSGALLGSIIEITWDTTTLPDARVAVLTITDGDSRRDLPLTQEQLAARKVIYTPLSSKIEVVLEVFSPDRPSTREAVTFLASIPTASKPVTRRHVTVDGSSQNVSGTPARRDPVVPRSHIATP
jgi:hypothetical protein